MAKQELLDRAYMGCAISMSTMSHAQRKQVGSIIAKNGCIIGEGWNGTPSGFDNCCEIHNFDTGDLITKQEVIHAEANAIAKVAKSTNSSTGATLYCTLMPCFECAKQIIQAGIVRVVYKEHYPYPGHSGTVRTPGLELLQKAKVQVDKLPD